MPMIAIAVSSALFPCISEAALPGGIELRGSVIASGTSSQQFPRGMYKLPTGNGESFELIQKGVLANKGGAVVDDVYYAVSAISMFGELYAEISAYNASSWESVPYFLEPDHTVLASDVTVDPVSGKVYGCFYNDAYDGGYVFGTLDYKTGKRNSICDIPAEIGHFNGIAADADGSLYGISKNGKFYTINKETGATSYVGDTGLVPQYTSSATIDPESGRMFWTYSTDDTGALYEIDKSTGAASLLCTFPSEEEVCGIYVYKVPDYFAPKTPEPTLGYSDGTFTISWPAVEEDIKGNAISAADITYSVTRYPGAVQVAEKTKDTQVYDKITEPDDLTVYYYTVTAYNRDAASAEGKTSKSILGALNPPYQSDFSSSNALDAFTIIDANGDGVTWKKPMFDECVALSYSEELDADDWLIMPPVRLQGGYIYKLSFAVSSNDNFAERMEVKMGQRPETSAMTTTVLAEKEYACTNPVNEEIYITPQADGVYYIGFHGVSEPDRYILNLYDISVSAPLSPLAPAEVTEVKAVPDFGGALKAQVSFESPSKAIDGTDLQEISKIVIKRGYTTVETIENPKPGSCQTIVDEVTYAGKYTYEIVAYNSAGEGKKASATTFIGVNKPAKATGFTAQQTANAGEVTFSWKAPEFDKDGFAINPALVKYTITELGTLNDVTVAENIEGTSFTYRALDAGADQEFKQWAIYATTEGGTSGGTYSDLIAVGTPFVMPYTESFADSNLDNILGMSNDPYVVWETTTDSPDVAAQDDDNGYIYMSGYFTDDEASIFTGRIHVDGPNPGLSFHVFRLTGEDPSVVDQNEIDVIIKADGKEDKLITVVNSNLPKPAAWNRVSVSLARYVGKDIEITFVGRVKNFQNIAIDNIRVDRQTDYNLSVVSVSAPGIVKSEEPFDISVKLSNLGEKPADGYSVKLIKSGQEVASENCGKLEAGEYSVVKFTTTLGAIDEAETTYSAEIVFGADEDMSNNKSQEITVALRQPVHPTVGALNTTTTNEGVQLTWESPDLSGNIVDEVFEDFEHGSPFAGTFGDWTFIDRDQAPVGGFNSVTLPGIVNGETKSSFFVFDSKDMHESFFANSGTKYLAVLYPANKITADDWAISPLLNGEAQTISFKARSYNPNYPEAFEVLYSQTGKDPSDFSTIRSVSNVPSKWTGYEFDLPEGSKYFAIRYASAELFMLMVDDVKFIGATPASEYHLLGYNVYRDKQRLNEAPVTATEYFDTQAGNSKHIYHVTALYDKGESLPVEASSDMSGVGELTDSNVSISVEGHEIHITCPVGEHITIVSTDGRVVYSAISKGHNIIKVDKGIYIAQVGKKVRKLAVR